MVWFYVTLAFATIVRRISGLIAAIIAISLAKDGNRPTTAGGQDVSDLLTLPLIPHWNHSVAEDRADDDSNRRYNRFLGRGQEGFLTEINALYQGYGTHYVDLWIGTPPQRQTLIVDTGSAVTAFPCSGCKDCGRGYHLDDVFVEKRSKTFEVVHCNRCLLGHCSRSSNTCDLSVAYQEGSSWHAYEGKDLVYSGGPHDKALSDTDGDNNIVFPFRFGCQTRLTGLFKTQLADGIMGMEMMQESYWYQMHQQGALANQKFSLCFSRQPVASRDGTNAGVMTLGGFDRRLHLTPMVYAQQLNTHGWFAVNIKKIYLRTGGGERVVSASAHARVKRVDISEYDLNSGKIIIDSGTTDTYLTIRLTKPFSRAWKELTGRDYDNGGHRYRDNELLRLPTILFQLSGVKEANNDPTAPGLAGNLDRDGTTDIFVAMPPTHYMEYSSRTRKYTSRLYFNELQGGVLGANFMMGHDILFSADDGRLGFAESNCDYAKVAGSGETTGRF